jgi:hypothetical protein
MRKMNVEGNKYHINARRDFDNPIEITRKYVDKCFNFAYDMSFGAQGKHRNYRSGGQRRRRNGEIFINAFQGKIAEYAVYQFFTSNNINVSEPDLRTFDLGTWDSCDLLINNYRISVKSTKFFGNLLLLETRDWNERGEYIPNLGEDSTVYDFFILVRISPDGNRMMKEKKWLYCNYVKKEELYKIIVNDRVWEFDIPGFICRKDLIYIIENEFIIPQNAWLNGRTRMDADNYYVQAGDLRDIYDLVKFLHICNIGYVQQ